MSDNAEIEELKRQLEEERSKREKLEFEMQYEDKNTGFGNRKYLEKLIEDGEIVAKEPDFSLFFVQVEHLKTVNEKEGNDAGDTVLIDVAEILRNCFADSAQYFKVAGTRFLVVATMESEKFDAIVGEVIEAINALENEFTEIDYSMGIARLENYPDVDVKALLKEAEYNLHMKAAEKDQSEYQEVSVPAGRQKTILMIDDSLVQLKTLQAVLKDEYKLLLSTSGMEGYDIAKAKHPDLILLDYNMPVVDGKRIMQLLKRGNSTKNIPVIFVSGISERNKFLDVASLGPAGYLLKPVAQEDLIRTVKKALGEVK